MREALRERSAKHPLSPSSASRVPQRFHAPLILVWNHMQACNLTCKHCYQEAGHKPLADDLTTEQKLNWVDQVAEECVPFLAFAGGALTTNTERLV